MTIELLNIDCMEYMKGLEDNAFDICITSPPYNMNLRVNSKGTGYCSDQVGKKRATKYVNFHDNLTMSDYQAFLFRVMDELLRVNNLVFFNIQMVTGNKPALFKFMGRYAEHIKELIIWDKGKAQPAINDGALNSGYELIIVLGDNPIMRTFKRPNFKRGTVDNIFRIPTKKTSNNNHGATFPLSLVETILRNFAHKGQKVFDPFLGTGTSAIAAHYGGFDFVGCELDTDYYNAAMVRFDAETSQLSLL